ncbi:SDR family oxidoreductase [Sunxiuqinia sp. sy24]|uniref:SDR family oxidoreductase n=1 Tax=Sunxiuqinia sp. sy24 TaxID=3461495 RepID=UPI004045F1D7
MKKIIINGANGYIAANFINKLLLQNYKIIALVRTNKKFTAQERMQSALTEINKGQKINTQNLEVYDYALGNENFALQAEQLKEIFSSEVDYFHFAASLKYDSKSKDEIFTTNLDGLKNSIKVYSTYAQKTSRFVFISTAYSCGKFDGLFKEKFYDNEAISSFRNYYEQSKRFAENILKNEIKTNGLNARIIRLSQVIGNNETGITNTDYGIFDFAKRIHSLASRHPNHKVRVRVDPEATQNLIPIDTVVNYLIRTVEVYDAPVIMNFIARKSTRNSHIIDSLNKLLPIQLIPTKDLNPQELTALERIISIGMSFTGSYTDINILFDTTNLEKLGLSAENEANEDSVFSMLEYFIQNLSEKKDKATVKPHTRNGCTYQAQA